MAGLGEMAEVAGAAMDTRGTATTPTVVVQITGADSQERTAELYAPPGVASSPTPGDSALSVPVGQGGRIVVAVHNYKIEVPVEPGELVVYSTDGAGEAVKASAHFGADGSIEIDADGGAGTVTVNAATVELGGEKDAARDKHLVTHEELKTTLDTLVGDVNAWLNALKDGLAGHTHVVTSAPPTNPPLVTPPITNQDVALQAIDDSKTEFIKTLKG